MPVQERSHDGAADSSDEEAGNPIPPDHSNGNGQCRPDGDKADDCGSSSSSSREGEREQFVIVNLSEVRKEVQCPICLGIIRKTRTVMECLHRFCRECIDKSMRMGNNECPACRTHCASRRSLRDDPNYDALITALYPDIDKYEEEESTFHEEEKARNTQIQTAIAQTVQRQSEALHKKRTARGTVSAFARKSLSRRRGRDVHRSSERQGSDDHEDVHGDTGKNSSSDDDGIGLKSRRFRRCGDQFSQSSSAVSADGNGDGNDFEVNREHVGISAGLVGPSDGLSWGKGGMRSHTRHGSVAGGNGSQTRYSSLGVGISSRSQTRFSSLAVGNGSHTPCSSPGIGNGSHTPCSSPGVGNDSHTPYCSPGVGNGSRTPYSSPVVGKGTPSSPVSGNCNNAKSRCARLADYLRNLVEKDEELDVNLMLIPVDEQRIPNLQQPYLCCRPTLSIKSLCQYVALETALQANEIEIYMVKESHGEVKPSSPKASESVVIDTSHDKLQILKEEETLAELKAPKLQHGHVLLRYHKK